jgi:hypothetical protein
MPTVPSPLAARLWLRPRAGEIGPVRREIIFEPVHEQPAPAEPAPAPPEREPDSPTEPVPDGV